MVMDDTQPATLWLQPHQLAKLADCHRGTVNKARRNGRIPRHLWRQHATAGKKPFYDYRPEAAEYLKIVEPETPSHL